MPWSQPSIDNLSRVILSPILLVLQQPKNTEKIKYHNHSSNPTNSHLLENPCKQKHRCGHDVPVAHAEKHGVATDLFEWLDREAVKDFL